MDYPPGFCSGPNYLHPLEVWFQAHSMGLVRYCVDHRLPLHPLYQGKGSHQGQKVVFRHYGLGMVVG